MANWDETRERLKQRIRTLTGNDILLVKEREEALLARLEAKLGETREVILKILSQL